MIRLPATLPRDSRTAAPARPRRSGPPALLLALALFGCSEESDPIAGGEETGDEGSSSGGDDTPHAILLATVSNSICDSVGVVAVQLEAVQIGCERPAPAPCTKPANPPPVIGDRVSCPITDPDVTLGVRIELAAEYSVEVVADRSPEAETRECFAESTMLSSVRVTSIDLDVAAQKMLVGKGSACPG